MNGHQQRVLVIGMAFILTSCINRGSSPVSIFPIKSGEMWESTVNIGNRTITTKFQLGERPSYNDIRTGVEASLITTGDAKRGLGYVFFSNNTFTTYFWLSDKEYDSVSCQVHYGESLGKTTKGFSHFVLDGTGQTLQDGCSLTRI